MLKITHVARDSNFPLLILEGKIIGRWVSELKSACAQYLGEGKRITLDLSDVNSIDIGGVRVLRQLTREKVQVNNYSLHLLNTIRRLDDF